MLSWPLATRSPLLGSPLPLRFPRGISLAIVVGPALLLALFAAPVAAQVQMNCVAVPLPSAYPGDWRSTHSLCLLTMTNNLAEPIRCDLRVQLDQAGGSGAATEPRVFGPGQTVLVTQNIMNWGRLRFQGSVEEAMDRTGHLPAKPLTINLFCENMVGVNSGNLIGDVQIQLTIIPSVPSPPTLLTPADAGEVRTPAPAFTWTPVRMTTGQEVWYQFRLVRVLPGQSAARALEANDPMLETFVHQSSLPYPSAAPRFEDGAVYAWRVQALLNASTSVNDAPVAGGFSNLGLNEGRSQVRSFAWRRPDAVGAVRSLAGDPVDPRGAAFGATGSRLGAESGPSETPKAARVEPGGAPTFHIASPTDSLAFALLRPRRNWWGPTSGGRDATLVRNAGIPTAQPASATGSPDPTGLSEGAAAVEGAPGPPPTPGIEIDPSGVASTGLATRWFRIMGTSVAAGEIYGRSGAGEPTRPDRTGQFTAGVTVGLMGNKLQVPVQALISGDQVSFRQTINQFSLHPEFRWGGVHAGNVRPGYSRFSLADASVLGGGADVVRGNWYAGLVSGRMNKAIQGDVFQAVEARFERNVLAGRVGYGQPLGDAIELVVMRALDDAGSLPEGDTLVRVAPAGNTVFEARARRAVFDTTLTVQFEAALSRFDRNVDADLPTVNGGAVGTRIQHRTQDGELALAFDYTGGGFQTMGNSDLPPDRIEGRISGRRTLGSGRLRLGGALGLGKDDVSGTLGGETKRRSLAVQAGWQPNALFGADFDLGLLSSKSPGTEFRAGLQDLTASYSLSPRLAWTWAGTSQSLNTTLAVQSVGFSDADAQGFANSRTTTLVCGWQSSLSAAVFVSMTGNYVRSSVAGQVTEVGAAGPGVSMTLLGGRAQTNVQLLVTQTRSAGFGIDRELTPNIDARYFVNGRQSLTFRAGWRRFRTGAPVGDFQEHLATLQYSAAL